MQKKINVTVVPESSLWTDQWASDDLDTLIDETLQQATSFISEKLARPHYAVATVLTDDQRIQELNLAYRKKDKPTNILSFPDGEDDDGEIYLGDLILAFETIKRESEEQKKQINDHLKHLLIHGFLHLLGYDHIQEQEAEEMEALEIEILTSIGIKNPYIDQKIC